MFVICGGQTLNPSVWWVRNDFTVTSEFIAVYCLCLSVSYFFFFLIPLVYFMQKMHLRFLHPHHETIACVLLSRDIFDDQTSGKLYRKNIYCSFKRQQICIK